MQSNHSFDATPLSLSRFAGLSLAIMTFAPALAMAGGTMNATPMLSGSTITAADCSFGAVNSAVKIAEGMNQAGLTVAIPAGTCEWDTNELTVPGRIALKGAGRDLTIIKRNKIISGVTFLVRFDCSIYKNAKFSDMTLEGLGSKLSVDRGLGLTLTCVDFRVSNAKFTKFSYAGVEIRGGATTSGVIFSNQFINNYVPGINLGYGVVVYGAVKAGEERPELRLGIEKAPGVTHPSAVFVESNFMEGNRHHIAANNGARYVFRHNAAFATDATKDFPQVDAHGLVPGSWPRGTRSWEVYGNSFNAKLTLGGGSIAIGMRGGDGVIFGNSYATNITKPIQLSIEGQNIACDNIVSQTDQTTDGYINEIGGAKVITNLCKQRLREGVEYRLGVRPGYTPYTYPHPLRASPI